MNWLSPAHMLFFGVVALLLFGNRLPEIARSLGRAINEFKKGLSDVQRDINRAGQESDTPPQRLNPPDATQAPADVNPATSREEQHVR
ncbi:MAG: Sec-independent protein translocase protein TatA [Phycisphaerae bacterium]|nr:Sec-independent protein translocase protein TatA [Phycisphaerae bacterium]